MRAIVNNTTIFELKENETVAINCTLTDNTLYVNNGFQSSKKIKIKYKPDSTYFFHVNAIVDNTGLLTGLGVSLLLFAAYIFSGIKLLLIMANIPILMLVYVFFLNPKTSIVLKSWKPATGRG